MEITEAAGSNSCGLVSIRGALRLGQCGAEQTQKTTFARFICVLDGRRVVRHGRNRGLARGFFLKNALRQLLAEAGKRFFQSVPFPFPLEGRFGLLPVQLCHLALVALH